MISNKLWALTVFLCLCISGIGAQSTFPEEDKILRAASFHENVEVRSAMSDAIHAPFYSLLTRQTEIHQQILSDVSVEFELRKSEDSFYLLFKNELDYKFPVWGRGNYIIKRDLRSGDFMQMKIFLQNDERTFIRVFPLDSGRSSLELTLYGETLYSGIVIPVSIEDLSTSSFSRILSLTRGTIQWNQILSDASYPEWTAVQHLVHELSLDLDYLYEHDDAALNSQGQFCYIESGLLSNEDGGVNCSGFAKWVADGLLLGKGGTLLNLEELKVPTEYEAREANPWSSARPDRDPYFGLDWSRNISARLRDTEPGKRNSSPLDYDVKGIPYYKYKENVGYKLENIQTLLYLQAVKEPGYIYFGAVNSLYGKDPALWQYHHIVVFFPWFDKNGDFHLDIMETGDRSSVENLNYRYPLSFVHLSKAKAHGDFVSPWEPVPGGAGDKD